MIKVGLKFDVTGLRFRRADGALKAGDQLRLVGQRLSNPAVIRLRGGDNLTDLSRIIEQRMPLDLQICELNIAPAAAIADGATKIQLPEMIDDSRLPFKVARGVVPESLSAGRAAAAKMKVQEPGRMIRIPTEPELLELNKLLGDQLEGKGYWIWTETEHEDYSGRFVLRHQDYDYRSCDRPGIDYGSYAVRFVEDK